MKTFVITWLLIGAVYCFIKTGEYTERGDKTRSLWYGWGGIISCIAVYSATTLK